MLENLAQSFPKPKAIIFLSAHSVSSDQVHILKTKKNWIQYDFMGFPDELYQVKYECPGDEAIATEIASALEQAGFKTQFDQNAPLDHGVWIPLLHLYPKGDVPVVRVSLPLNLIPAQILKMGHALSKFREQGILVMSSGGAVHNLKQLKWSEKNGAGSPWAQEFEEWLIQTLQKKDVDALITAEEHPLFHKAHPSQEHFLPILFSVGAALPSDEVKILQRGVEYESLSMLSFSLNLESNPSLQ